MMDIDDVDRVLRDALASAAAHDVSPIGPAQQVADRLRRRQQRRTALRASIAAAVCTVIIGGVALSARVSSDHRSPSTRPVTPSVLSTRQTAGDLAARARIADLDPQIDWSSIRLITQSGSTRLYGARDTHGELCVALLLAEAASTGCGSRTQSPAARSAAAKLFAAHGASTLTYTAAGNSNAFGLFVPDSVRSAAIDGVPVPIARNGILLVFTTSKMPSLLTVTSKTGTEKISFSRSADGSATASFSGAFG
jgi:hypothetical protein